LSQDEYLSTVKGFPASRLPWPPAGGRPAGQGGLLLFWPNKKVNIISMLIFNLV
jgi:hypothetical protein